MVQALVAWEYAAPAPSVSQSFYCKTGLPRVYSQNIYLLENNPSWDNRNGITIVTIVIQVVRFIFISLSVY
jgi:hypothetical protein